MIVSYFKYKLNVMTAYKTYLFTYTYYLIYLFINLIIKFLTKVRFMDVCNIVYLCKSSIFSVNF